MLGQKFCEKVNRMERARGGNVRAVPAGKVIVFTVQTSGRVQALREIAGAAFAAGCVLNMDGAAVMDNGSGVYTASIMAD